MSYELFYKKIEETAKSFKKADYPIHVVSHLDADGLSSASIMIKALKKENKPFIVSIVKQVTSQILERLSKESYPTVLFVDLGSGNLKQISLFLKEKTVFILDHHQIQETNFKGHHLNPLSFGIGPNEISGSGIAYLFAKSLNEENRDLAHLAVLGAIGDMQENKGFKGLNAEILKEATNIEVKTGLRMFGVQTRPLHKILEYSYNPYIPTITGSEEGAIRFLKELEIPIKENDKFRTLSSLSKEETKKLITGIVLKRIGKEKSPEDILGPCYVLKDEEENLPTKELKEFSTLLNCCGRLNKPSYGIGACLNDPALKQKAIDLLSTYRLELVNALNWFHENRETEAVKQEEHFVIIKAEQNIRDTLIGTVCSLIANSGFYKEGTIILGLAHTLDDYSKVSIRISGRREINLKEILEEITETINCDAGGHNQAAGALIPIEKEKEFIESALDILKKRELEIA